MAPQSTLALFASFLLLLLVHQASAGTSCTSFPCSSPNNMNLPIPIIGDLSYTFTLSNLKPVIPSGATITFTTFIQHPYSGDLIFTLTSPSGSSITLVNRTGGSRDDIYMGTKWTDAASFTAVKYLFDSKPLCTFPLKPEQGCFAQFAGEDPNGVWTFTVSDVEVQDQGFIQALILDYSEVGKNSFALRLSF